MNLRQPWLRATRPKSVHAQQVDTLILRGQHSDPELGTMMYLFDGEDHVGKLAYRTCSVCRRGLISKISVYAPYDDRGVGRHLIETLVYLHPGLTWYTTGQQPSAVGFWQRMAEYYNSPFTEARDYFCEHDHASTAALEGHTFRIPVA